MPKRKTKLEIGKFYMAYGGNAHPAQIYKKTSHGTYISIKTGTTYNKDMIEIKPTQDGLAKSYVHKRPFEGTKKDYGNKELLGISFNQEDLQTIEMVKKRRPQQSKKAKLRYKNKKMPSSD